MNNRSKVKELLIQRLDREWARFRSNYQQAMAGLQQDLDQLRSSFGDEVIGGLLNSSKDIALGWTKQPPTKKVAHQTAKTTSKPRERRRRRSKRSRQDNQLRFSDTKDPVLSAVQRLKPLTEFTAKDIETALRTQGLNVNPGYVSLVLSQYLDGLQKTSKRRNEESGRMLNVYRFEDRGTVKLRNDAEARSQHKPRHKKK